MTDFIESKLKQTAVKLADTEDVARAAKKLGISSAELERRIKELEDRLCLKLFVPDSNPPVLTDEGRFLVRAFREALARDKREEAPPLKS